MRSWDIPVSVLTMTRLDNENGKARASGLFTLFAKVAVTGKELTVT